MALNISLQVVPDYSLSFSRIVSLPVGQSMLGQLSFILHFMLSYLKFCVLDLINFLLVILLNYSIFSLFVTAFRFLSCFILFKYFSSYLKSIPNSPVVFYLNSSRTGISVLYIGTHVYRAFWCYNISVNLDFYCARLQHSKKSCSHID